MEEDTSGGAPVIPVWVWVLSIVAGMLGAAVPFVAFFFMDIFCRDNPLTRSPLAGVIWVLDVPVDLLGYGIQAIIPGVGEMIFPVAGFIFYFGLIWGLFGLPRLIRRPKLAVLCAKRFLAILLGAALLATIGPPAYRWYVSKPLHEAAASGDAGRIRALIDSGADLNAKDDKGRTPLRVCSNAESLRLLIDHGADLNAQDSFGRTALCIFADHADPAHQSMAIALIKAGADINRPNADGETPLHTALREFGMNEGDNSKLIQELFAAGADLRAPDKDGMTPLHLVAICHKDAFLSVFKPTADVNVRNINGDTPLHMAAWNRNPAAAKAILIAGGDFHAKNNSGETPLHLAVSGGWRASDDIIQLLLAAGADVCAPDSDGLTPLHLAAENTGANIEVLIRNHPGIDIRDKNGQTPLHCAVRHDNVNGAKTLLSAGAGVAAKDNDGETPLHFAYSRANDDMVSLLMKSGADPNEKNNKGRTPSELKPNCPPGMRPPPPPPRR